MGTELTQYTHVSLPLSTPVLLPQEVTCEFTANYLQKWAHESVALSVRRVHLKLSREDLKKEGKRGGEVGKSKRKWLTLYTVLAPLAPLHLETSTAWDNEPCTWQEDTRSCPLGVNLNTQVHHRRTSNAYRKVLESSLSMETSGAVCLPLFKPYGRELNKGQWLEK